MCEGIKKRFIISFVTLHIEKCLRALEGKFIEIVGVESDTSKVHWKRGILLHCLKSCNFDHGYT